MKIMLYALVCMPTLLMLVSGLLISTVRRDSAMVNHHHASNFNINSHTRKTITIFAVTGILFSVSGALLLNGLLAPGIIIMCLDLVGFIIAYSLINK